MASTRARGTSRMVTSSHHTSPGGAAAERRWARFTAGPSTVWSPAIPPPSGVRSTSPLATPTRAGSGLEATMLRAASSAASASLSWLRWAPKTARMPSPKNLSTVPPRLRTSWAACCKAPSTVRQVSSSGWASRYSVKRERSKNSTVTQRRSWV
ncbi:hypothetical protein Mterra_03665 [Calidithermus terrae]|uniref:Uncharacterized protein n=1 Tax=Calidithermus terrae TaxID=1408545 RepID=A0A399E1T1_9DEIN|nr:hypothetical protein Mterra_03665 [Calidithermus terrae]